MIALRNSTLLDNFFDSFFDNNFLLDKNCYVESNHNFYYDDENKEHVMSILVPGFKKDEIEIKINNKGISIKGEIKEENKKGFGNRKVNYFFKREEIDSNSVKASLEDGVLSLRFKTISENSIKKIEIT